AKDSLQAKTEGYSVGADSYITKPFSANLLHTRISNLLESREKIKSIFSAPTYAKSVIANTLGELDNEFIEKVVNMIEENLSSEQVNIGYLADQMYMSHSTFYRKIKALTGLSATDFIRKIRIQHAKKMLASQKYSITEIAYKVGFGGLSSLRKAFKAELGISPSEFLKQEDEKLNTQE
ncbi:MAG TPA: DNA-binding response regulator, partial [Salinivirgaceae bacterium]|nr:DNA-binding response regulator [Salinivirgaceae bacterium]